MSALALGGTDIPVAPDGHRTTWSPRGQMTRSAGGYLRSNVTAVLGRRKIWRFATPPLTTAQASVVRPVLRTVTAQTATGYLVDSGASVFVRNRDEDTDLRADFTTFTFELHATTTT